MEKETKFCKYCQSEIPEKAKVCPNCRKKQSGKLKWIIVAVIVVAIISAIAGGGSSDKPKAKKTSEVVSSNNSSDNTSTDNSNTSTPEEINNIFNVGDVVETDNFKITYLSAGVYYEDNEFLQPKEGYEYWKFDFKFENISDTDQSVSSLADWTCYSDNSKVDQSYLGDDNGLDATLSAGRTTEGSVYFEVPANANKIELEYDISFWQSDKIIFIGK